LLIGNLIPKRIKTNKGNFRIILGIEMNDKCAAGKEMRGLLSDQRERKLAPVYVVFRAAFLRSLRSSNGATQGLARALGARLFVFERAMPDTAPQQACLV